MRLWTGPAAAVCVLLIGGCGGTQRTASRTKRTTPTSQAVTTTTAAPIAYVVREGDTLTAVARQFRVSVASIVVANRLPSADQLHESERLRIPRAAPVRVIADPAVAFAGQKFKFTLTGAVPTETVRFDVATPDGLYTGGPHAVPAHGVVTGSFRTSPQDPAGVYHVTAIGSFGTRVSAYFGVGAAAPTNNP